MSGRVKHITKLARETSRVALVVGLLAATPIVYLAAPAFAQEFRFNQVTVTGNQRVDTPSVVAFAGIERGQTVSAGALNEAYQRIVNSGLFESVEITPRGNTLQITVQEWPTINRINIEGMKFFIVANNYMSFIISID